MHETTIRFSDELWVRVRQASRRNGTSAAQFVRDATVARVAVEPHVGVLQHELAVALRRFDVRLQRVEDTLRRHGLR